MAAQTSSEHWSQVWTDKNPAEVSWFEEMPRASLALIKELNLPLEAPILDLGGGASGLAVELRRRGYTDVTVADIAPAALEKARESKARESLGPAGEGIEWVVADVRSHDFGRRFALWHDRAVFHFMTDAADRHAYLETLRRSVVPGGHLIIATFGPEGPTSCSGLPVVRYSGEELADTLGPGTQLVSCHLEDHHTPSGNTQQFLYAHLETR